MDKISQEYERVNMEPLGELAWNDPPTIIYSPIPTKSKAKEGELEEVVVQSFLYTCKYIHFFSSILC